MIDTQKLRQRILDLAIRGKLVPQDPNDEPASVLLERIRAEKERLIAEGKIKRPKKSKASSAPSHYQNFTPPFEIPDSWEWVRLGDVIEEPKYGTSAKSSSKGKIPVLRMGNINKDGTVDYSNLVYSDNNSDIIDYQLKKGDILFNRTNSSDWVGKSALYNGEQKAIFAGYLVRVRPILILSEYLILVMTSDYYRNWCYLVKTDAVNQSNINARKLVAFMLPLPPLKEQKRIIDSCFKLSKFVWNISDSCKMLSNMISLTKAKILDLAMQGKLVPQDSADEPAADMLMRINPKAKIITDNPHYPQLPDNWVYVSLEDITEYEQPQPYIVRDTSYSDKYTIPVLTAGKSFVLGYTNEDFGVYEDVPAIIFDDFTTDSRLVNFPFKVKSSAMKIIQVKKGLNIEYAALFMSRTRLIGETHKRYWISEYSKILIPIPPLKEQYRIVEQVNILYHELDKIISILPA